jgi:hypothetical protein
MTASETLRLAGKKPINADDEKYQRYHDKDARYAKTAALQNDDVLKQRPRNAT